MDARKNKKELSVKMLTVWFVFAIAVSAGCSIVVWLATMSNFDYDSQIAMVVENTGLRYAAFEVSVRSLAPA